MVGSDLLAQREALVMTNANLPHMIDKHGPIPVIILEWTGVDQLGWPCARVLVQAPHMDAGYQERVVSMACLNAGVPA